MWRPLLTGSLAERALDSAVETAQGLTSLEEASEFRVPGLTAPDASVGTGASGVALCLSYLSDSGVFPSGRAKARDLFDFSAGIMAEIRLDPSLLDGFAGIGWTARRFLLESDAASESDALSDIDSELLTVLSRSRWKSHYDLVSGLAGIGIYALSRLPRVTARACVSRIVDHLADLSEVQGSGVTWHTPPALLTAPQREAFPEGHYNLGLAHGVPGVVAFLGQVCASGVSECEKKARDLLFGAVVWLLENKQPGPGRFLYYAGPGVPRRESRCAWCYGDPGVAAALLLAARGVKEEAWEREAVDLALLAAQRPVAEAGVVDPGLCHGSSGLAHIFNRFYQETGDPRFARVSTFWFEQTLAMRDPGTGIGGYRSAMKIHDEQLAYHRDPTFLTGAAGTAAALAAAVTSAEPEWDQLLMLSSVGGRVR